MTPLSRFFSRFLPSWLAAGALGVIYAAVMASILMTASDGKYDNIYVDVREGGP